MKEHSSGFKEQIALMGRQQSILITYTENGNIIQLTNDEINSAIPNYQCNLLKSAMKNLEIDSNIEIPEGTKFNFKYGILVNNEYEYIDYGQYIVKSVEKQEDNNSYLLNCYDNMLYSMIDYTDMGIEYPITIRDYINKICEYLGINFANKNDEFANFDKAIPYELYLDLGYKFRDVLDELAQVTASIICINQNDELEIRYMNDTKDIINEEYLKDSNVNFSKKYGPINSVVLSRSADSDNIFLKDDQSILVNGLCEIKISDNQIMNFNNRNEFLPDILEYLKNVEYYINDYTSTGIMYYDLFDKYYIEVFGKIYDCLMLNDEQNITQGLEENIYCEEPDESVTDYSKADKTDQRLKQAYIIVDKQNQKIQGFITDTEGKFTEMQQTVDEISQKVSSVTDVKKEINSINQLHLTNCGDGFGYIWNLSIRGNLNNLENGFIKLVSDKQDMSSMSEEAQIIPILINEPLRVFNNIYDELVITNTKTELIKRIGIIENLIQNITIQKGLNYFGNEINVDSKMITDFIEVNENSTYYCSITSKYTWTHASTDKVCFYDENKQFIDFYALSGQEETNIVAGAKFIRVEFESDEVVDNSNDYTVSVSENGNVGDLYILDKEEIIALDHTQVKTFKPDTYIYVQNNNNLIYECLYLVDNDYVDVFAQQTDLEKAVVELNSSIKQTAENINLEVSTKVVKDDVVSSVNLSSEAAKIKADKIELSANDILNLLSGNTINIQGKNINIESDNFKVTPEGILTAINAILNNVTIKGGNIEMIGDNTTPTIRIIDYDNGEIEMYTNNFYMSYFYPGEQTQVRQFFQKKGYYVEGNGSSTSVDYDGIITPKLTQTSLESSKKNFEKLENALEEVLNTDIYKYNLKSQADGDKKHIGFVIGENYKYSKQITALDNDGKEIGVDTYSMISMLYKAFQEEHKNVYKELEELKKKLEEK